MEVKALQPYFDRFLEDLDEATGAKLARIIVMLGQYGSMLGMPHSRHIGQNLFELRVRGKQEARVLYTFHRGLAILVHGFIKKTDEIPEREIKTAETRIQALDAT